MAFKLLNRARMSVTGTPGTGAITLGSALTGYQTFAAAGLANADTTPYLLEDGAAWEIGLGTYTSSGISLARTTITASSNANSAITATSGALVSATVRAADIVPTSLVSLQDVIATEGAGINGYTLNWNQSASGWEPVAPLTVPTNASVSFSALSDVNVTEGSSINGYVPVWDNTTSCWLAAYDAGIPSPPSAIFGSSFYHLSGTTFSQNLVAGKGLTVQRTDGGTGTRYAFAGQAVPSGATWSVTARMKLICVGSSSQYVGLAIGDASSTYWVGIVWNVASVAVEACVYQGSFSSINTYAVSGGPPEYWSITYSSGTFTFYVSWDNATWFSLGTTTTGTFTQYSTSTSLVGVVLYTGAATNFTGVSILNWLVDNTATAGG